MAQNAIYDGYLRDHVPEIVRRYKCGETARAIGLSIYERHFISDPNVFPWTAEANVKYVLRRTGNLPAPVKPTLAPANVPDGMDAIEWINREDCDEWPKGAWTRMHSFATNEHHNYPTVGALRRASDSELLRTPNFGKATLTVMRQRLGVTQETALHHNLDIHAAINEIREMRYHLGRIEQWLLGAHYSLTRNDVGAVDGSPSPDEKDPG